MEKETLGEKRLDRRLLETGGREPDMEAPSASEIEADVWIQGFTDDGQAYYYNTLTGEAQWEKPEGFKGETSKPTESKNESSSGQWMEVLSSDGRTYYYNTETEETSWEKPAEFCPLEEGSSEGKEEGQGKEDTPSSEPEPLSGEDESLTDREPGADEAKDSRLLQRTKQEEDKDDDDEEDYDNDYDDHDDNDGDDEDNDDKPTPPEDEEEEETPAKKARKTSPCATAEQAEEEQAEEEQDQNEPGDQEECEVKIKEHSIAPAEDKGATRSVNRKRKLENGKSRSFQ